MNREVRPILIDPQLFYDCFIHRNIRVLEALDDVGVEIIRQAMLALVDAAPPDDRPRDATDWALDIGTASHDSSLEEGYAKIVRLNRLHERTGL